MKRSLSWLLLPLLALTGAHGQAFNPDALPPLQPQLLLEPLPAGPARISWQLHQQLYWSPGSNEGSLALNPSVNVLVHDPLAAVNDGIRGLDAALHAAEQSDRAAREALELHTQFLSLQGNLWFQDFLLDWLEHWHALPPPESTGPDRTEAQLMAAEAMLLETEGTIELQLLKLAAGNVHVMQGPEAWFRPALSLAGEPLATCLTGSRELRQLELLQRYGVLDAELHAAGRRQRVELNVGASVTLTGTGSPDLGWNIGLRVSRADHAGAQFGLDAAPGSISQSLTLRPPQPEAAPEPVDLTGAADREAIRLLELLRLSEQAARQEELKRRSADQELDHLRSRIDSGEARRADLQVVLDGFIELAQAVSYRDWALLSLAVECRLPLTYRTVAVYP